MTEESNMVVESLIVSRVATAIDILSSGIMYLHSLIETKMHDPIFAPIEFEFDKNARIARLVIPGVLESDVEPIKNPVTGTAHRIQVMMPEGFEHHEGEVASANIHSHGAIPFETQGSHSTLAHVVQTPQGVAP